MDAGIEQVHQTHEDLWDLFRLGSKPGEHDLPAYLQKVCEFCGRWFEADSVSLFLREEGGDSFRLCAAIPSRSPERRGGLPLTASFRLGEGFAGMAAANGAPLVLKDGDHSGLISTKTVVGSAMVVPLVTPLDECVGVLNVSRRSPGSKYRKADVDRAVAISQHLALAVENATLVARLQTLAATNKNIVESLQAAVVSIGKDGRITETNRQALKMIGMPRAHLAGRNWTDLFTKFGPKAVREISACVEAAHSGRVRRKRLHVGADSHYQICASPAPSGNVTLVIEDVSRSVRQDRQLERSMRLAEIGQLTAAVAHEIRNPLTSIKGAAQMINEEASLHDARKWGKVIVEEAEALNELCADFLDLTRQVSLNKRQIDLALLTALLLQRSEAEFRAAKVSYDLTAEPNLPIIWVDAGRLGQAVRNLLRNAIQAMPDGGKISVNICAKGRTLEMSIEDTGIGMTQDQLGRLFTPFFTTKAQGTGLGLCNVRKIIDAHGGTISVTSKRGEGTKFVIQLPTGKRS